MRLYKPDNSLAHEAVKEATALLTCVNPVPASTVESVESLLLSMVKTEEHFDILRAWADRKFSEGLSLDTIVPEMSAGVAALKDPDDLNIAERNLLAFLGEYKNADNLVDLRTKTPVTNLYETVDTSLLEQFTVEYHGIARKLMEVLVEGIREINDKDTRDNLYVTVVIHKFATLDFSLLMSGMLPALISQVIGDTTPDMADLPHELLHAMFFDGLAKSIPYVEPFTTERFDNLRNAK